MSEKTVEFRGVDDLYIAEIIQDDADGYETGAPELLSDFAEISKTVESGKATKFYNNKAKITIKSEGADVIAIAVPVLALNKLSKVTGKYFDEATGAFIDCERSNKQYALGYRMKKTDGTWRYVWRLKGDFTTIPDETAATEDDGTDSNGQALEYSGVYTNHVFTKGGADGKGGAAKGVVADSDGKTDVSGWFTSVQTPDTVKAKTA